VPFAESHRNRPTAAEVVAPVSKVMKSGEAMPPVTPVMLVMSLFAPETAAERFPRAVAASVAPVPPEATASVPASVSVPAPVTGPPLKVRPVVPPEASTDVTVPAPAPAGAGPGARTMTVVAVSSTTTVWSDSSMSTCVTA